MTTKQKARQLALTLLGEDQNPEPLIDALIKMAQWQENRAVDKFHEWCEENFYIHPHDCHVIQYVSDEAINDIEDFVEDFRKQLHK